MSLPADLRRGSRGCCFLLCLRSVAAGLGGMDESPSRLASGVSIGSIRNPTKVGWEDIYIST